MKKTILLSFLVTMSFCHSKAQDKTISKSIISTSAAIKKFHEKAELDDMQKGELVELYVERINVIAQKLPFIALANKRGVSMNDIGIPDNSDNAELLDKQHKTIKTFVSETEAFERTITPFADKQEIIEAILFCEMVLKELRLIRS